MVAAGITKLYWSPCRYGRQGDQCEQVILVDETLTVRCSVKSGRVAYLVIAMGLVDVMFVILFVFGGLLEKGIGQVFLFLLALAVTTVPAILFLRRVRIEIDPEYVNIYSMVSRRDIVRRTEVASIKFLRKYQKLGFMDSSDALLAAVSPAFTKVQLAQLSDYLGVPYVG